MTNAQCHKIVAAQSIYFLSMATSLLILKSVLKFDSLFVFLRAYHSCLVINAQCHKIVAAQSIYFLSMATTLLSLKSVLKFDSLFVFLRAYHSFKHIPHLCWDFLKKIHLTRTFKPLSSINNNHFTIDISREIGYQIGG